MNVTSRRMRLRLASAGALFSLVGAVHADSASAQDAPAPELNLIGYDGDLCPNGTLDFNVSDGGLTITTSTDQSGSQSCHIETELVVPAGWRFRNPIFSSSLYASSAEPIPASQASFTYTLVGAGSETFAKTIVPVLFESEETDSVVIQDRVNITVPECTDPTQPIALKFNLDISANIQADTTLRITALDGEFTQGVEWTTCEEGF